MLQGESGYINDMMKRCPRQRQKERKGKRMNRKWLNALENENAEMRLAKMDTGGGGKWCVRKEKGPPESR